MICDDWVNDGSEQGHCQRYGCTCLEYECEDYDNI